MYPLSVVEELSFSWDVTVTVTEVVARLADDELIVTSLPETVNQAVFASVGLNVSVSVCEQAEPPLSV